MIKGRAAPQILPVDQGPPLLMMVLLLPFSYSFFLLNSLLIFFVFEPLNVLFGKDVDDTPQELFKLKLINI